MLKFIRRNKIKKQYVEIFVEVLLFSTPIPLKTYNVPQILNGMVNVPFLFEYSPLQP